MFAHLSPNVCPSVIKCLLICHQMFAHLSPNVCPSVTKCLPICHQMFAHLSPNVCPSVTKCSPICHQMVAHLSPNVCQSVTVLDIFAVKTLMTLTIAFIMPKLNFNMLIERPYATFCACNSYVHRI